MQNHFLSKAYVYRDESLLLTSLKKSSFNNLGLLSIQKLAKLRQSKHSKAMMMNLWLTQIRYQSGLKRPGPKPGSLNVNWVSGLAWSLVQRAVAWTTMRKEDMFLTLIPSSGWPTSLVYPSIISFVKPKRQRSLLAWFPWWQRRNKLNLSNCWRKRRGRVFTFNLGYIKWSDLLKTILFYSVKMR